MATHAPTATACRAPRTPRGREGVMFDRRLFEALDRGPREPIVRSPPVFPLPGFDGQPPVLLVFDPEDHGVEIAYENSPSEDRSRVRSATRESTLYSIPRMLPVFVAA